ncbi:hypothetical protein Y032_0104g3593 [Ancylostoma ceylanicum]|uniref:Uncharacterized protein n=1 Tax=Ancylostoma ceylanicum TaxID=53326 RepID=A0A016TGD6_9BILA|nr:hypothetical protein Y032_0104g3593 [Ancylostoma ceylanicum]
MCDKIILGSEEKRGNDIRRSSTVERPPLWGSMETLYIFSSQALQYLKPFDGSVPIFKMGRGGVLFECYAVAIGLLVTIKLLFDLYPEVNSNQMETE